MHTEISPDRQGYGRRWIPLSTILSFLPLIHPSPAICQVPSPTHVVIVIEENHDYSQIIGSSYAPYINALAADSKGALFTQSFALTHPSQPNYLMLFSGSNQGVTNDNVPPGLPFTTLNLGGSLFNYGKSFAGYSEDLPSPGYTGASSGAYARKHNPWVNWQGSPASGIPASANLPLTSFPVNFDSLPAVSFVIPNQDNDMHNGSDPATIRTGDAWLQLHLDSYIQWAKTHSSLFVLTFDEGTSTGANQVVTIFVGSMVKAGHYTETVTHYSLLRTLEDMYALPHAGGSMTATPITVCWTVATDIHTRRTSFPESTMLAQCYPNPFNPETHIRFRIASGGMVRLAVYDILGREAKNLVNERMEPGDYDVRFDATGLASGLYLYRLQTGDFDQSRTLTLVR